MLRLPTRAEFGSVSAPVLHQPRICARVLICILAYCRTWSLQKITLPAEKYVERRQLCEAAPSCQFWTASPCGSSVVGQRPSGASCRDREQAGAFLLDALEQPDERIGLDSPDAFAMRIVENCQSVPGTSRNKAGVPQQPRHDRNSCPSMSRKWFDKAADPVTSQSAIELISDRVVLTLHSGSGASHDLSPTSEVTDHTNARRAAWHNFLFTPAARQSKALRSSSMPAPVLCCDRCHKCCWGLSRVSQVSRAF